MMNEKEGNQKEEKNTQGQENKKKGSKEIMIFNKTYSYNIFKQIFCCLCIKQNFFYGQRKFDSQKRVKVWQELIKQSSQEHRFYELQDNILCPLEVLTHLYSQNNRESICQLEMVRINPNLKDNKVIRNDLEFYIPQLCNFMVYHQSLKNKDLNEFIENVCYVDFYFSHQFYWQIYSLTKTIRNTYYQYFPQVEQKIVELLQMCSLKTSNKLLEEQNLLQYKLNYYYNHDKMIQDEESQQVQNIIQNYGTDDFTEQQIDVIIKPFQIKLQNYRSIFSCKPNNSYLSTIYFFEDLIQICEELGHFSCKDEKKQKLIDYLKEVNGRLPAAVYIPFIQGMLSKQQQQYDDNTNKQIRLETMLFSIQTMNRPYYLTPTEEHLMPFVQRYSDLKSME